MSRHTYSMALMRNISQLVVSLALLATQVRIPATDATALAEASSDARGSLEVSLNFANARPVEFESLKPLDYEAEVLTPLHAAQAAQAEAQAKVKAAATRTVIKTASVTKTTTVVPAGATAQNMLALRKCESGNVYSRNSGNGYYGAYQYDIRTWAGYGGYARADLAPADVQDAKFLETFARRGWSPWPACSRKLGLR
ncbi:transglycosylase family protein [bacterium]|nr:MAG: transglycosylase family protein [bacterium]